MLKTINKIKRWLINRFRPIKVGSSFIGNSIDFVSGRDLEKALHGIKSYSKEEYAEIVHGPGSYRITIVKDLNDSFECKTEVLVHEEFKHFYWMKRSVNRKFTKEMIRDFIKKKIVEKDVY